MNGTKAIRIATAKHAGEYKLHLRWVNGKTNTVDLSEPVHRLKGLRTLRDGSIFARAVKGEGRHSIVWPGRSTWAPLGSGKCRSSRMPS